MLILGHTSKTVLNILFDGVDHNGLALVGGAGLGESIQLFPLDLQYRLQLQQCAQRRGRRRNPASLFQIIQGVQHDINAAVKLIFFQEVLDLQSIHPFGGQ